MASGATFHAKITADARQFIKQIEESTKALSGLVSATGKKATGAKGKQAEQEVKSAYQQAQKMANQAHQQTMQQIKQENAERVKGVRDAVKAADYSRRTRAEGPLRPAGMGTRTGSVRSAFATSDTRARGVTGRTRLSDEQQLVAQAQKQRHEQVLIRAHRDAILEDRRRELNTQRQQLDAMVTGRYALYDMATAYQQVAYYAFQVTRALTQTVQAAGEFETAFTAVERAAVLEEGTAAFDHMRQSLIDLSTQLPVTFAEISEIATLGAQMGVAAADLTNFTRIVAGFSAVTGASIDETAEKFGRISALANVPVTEFENLASSVLFAGFNAVATEQEILSMSESIAAAAANAGYSAKQVVGLATALSSLGIAPEQARGVILRVFNTITRAIEGSTDKLDAFAAAAGMSAQQAQYLWKESPEQFFTALLNGLGSVEQLTLALDELGITNTREINVIQRLSGNMDVYTKSLQEAAQAYEEGSALQDIYGKTADNLDAKIQRLVNAFEALQAAAGSGMADILKPIVEVLVDVTNAVSNFMRTGVGKAILPIVTGFAAATAVIAGFRAVTTLATAQMLAMRTALLKMGEMGAMVRNPIKSLAATMTQQMYVTDALGKGTQFYTAKQLENLVSTGKLTEARKAEIIANNAATVSTQRLGIAMKALGFVSFAAIAATAIAGIIEYTRVTKEFGKEIGGVKSLSDALASDTKAFGELSESQKITTDEYVLHTEQVKKNTSELNPNAEALERLTGASEDFSEQNKLVTEAFETQTVAIGNNTRQWIANAIIQDESLQKILKDYPNFFNDVESLGLDFQGVLEQIFADPETNVSKLVEGQIRDSVEETKKQINELVAERNRLTKPVTGVAEADQERFNVLTDTILALEAQNEKLLTAKTILIDLGSAMGQAFDAQLISEMVNEVLGVQDAMEGVGDEAEDAEDDIDGMAKSLRTVLDYASDLDGIFDRIIGIEFGTTQAEDDIADAWEKIGDRADKAREAIEDANNEIKELTADRAVLEYQLSVAERYGDEKRAMQIRAKLGKVDADLADENEKLAEAQDEVSMTLEGQTKAARENRDAVDDLVGSYTDLIQAAVESGMQGEELEQYIESLKEEFYANGEAVGYSREELQKYGTLFDQFKTAVEQVDPRIDIQFNTNLSAVQNALNEFDAKLNAMNNKQVNTKHEHEEVVVVTTRPYSLKVNGSDVRLFRLGLESGALSYPDYIRMVYGVTNISKAPPGVGGSFLLRANGGFVSGPGGPKSDSIPAMLSNGEYVIQASAVNAYGMDFMNALNNQRVPMATGASSSAISANGGSTIAYLAPEDRALLRAVADRPVTLYADNTKIAQSANAGNQTLSQRGLK